MKPFRDIFIRATEVERGPFRFQERFAEELPSLVRVPTGAGKTAMAVLGWVWRRRFADNEIRSATPRRLVYCLPMRVLVEQTRDNASQWLKRLGLHDGDTGIAVSVLMGGEERDDWDLYPERETIVIGTQDMLLSRALNRGYGMSRFRWPMQYGLLNNDALWVFDEIQLMGSGLATTSQLEAFRSRFGTAGPTRSIWMSATLEREWLKTVDFAPPPPAAELALSEADVKESADLRTRMEADKPLHRATGRMGNKVDLLAKEVRDAHQPASRTLVVVNTVARAAALWEALAKAQAKAKTAALPKLVLLHSRFRPADRATRVAELLEAPAGPGTIVVSTQVVEAGVDVSAKVMFTELAPWASLVQRFGRCNRRGTDADARIYWIDWPEEAAGEAGAKKREDLALPYDAADLTQARAHLQQCKNVGPNHLPKVPLRYDHTHVIRRKDFVELFDTTPDLAGNDVDVSRYVREIEDAGVQVFWRELNHKAPLGGEPFPRRNELCSVSIADFRKFISKLATKESAKHLRAYRRNFLDKTWEAVGVGAIVPGQVLMLDADAGGYDPKRGWTGEPGGTVESLRPTDRTESDDGMDDDSLSTSRKWEKIADHTNSVCGELDAILGIVSVPEAATLRVAARWHDRGKAHALFQDAAAAVAAEAGQQVAAWVENREVAKTGVRGRLNYRRFGRPATHFRHELASALAILHPSSGIPVKERDLIAYLAAGHHGKVRLSIRSMPDELRPEEVAGGDDLLFARGVWHGDQLPPTNLGDDVHAPAVTLSLEPMALGVSEDNTSPFFGQPSWTERMLALRDRNDLGPFRLVYLEALLRAADQRASGTPASETNVGEDVHA